LPPPESRNANEKPRHLPVAGLKSRMLSHGHLEAARLSYHLRSHPPSVIGSPPRRLIGCEHRRQVWGPYPANFEMTQITNTAIARASGPRHPHRIINRISFSGFIKSHRRASPERYHRQHLTLSRVKPTATPRLDRTPDAPAPVRGKPAHAPASPHTRQWSVAKTDIAGGTPPRCYRLQTTGARV
jgi:hypothetical protein